MGQACSGKTVVDDDGYPSGTGSEMCRRKSGIAHQRLRKLKELDAATKVPFILVELRGEGHGDGYVEICGKDEYGVYAHLDEWLTSHWGCTQLDSGDLSDDTPLPFSERTYKWGGFHYDDAGEGTNSMGLNSMQLIGYMCNELSWTLGVINGGNVGKKGEIREQQLIFKAPHPMNLVVPHVLIELRSAGYIEVCGGGNSGIVEELDRYFKSEFGATLVKGHEQFCDRYYVCAEGIFKERGDKGENNVGLLTVQLCDFVGKGKPWSLVTMNGGNYGESGTHREQQLCFRRDDHPLGREPHLMVEMREAGFIEVNGDDVDGMYSKLAKWLAEAWGCTKLEHPAKMEAFCHTKFRWKPSAKLDMMQCTAEITKFFHSEGWQMQICSQGTVNIKGNADSREQQILFRPHGSARDNVEPHMVMELFMGHGVDELYQQPDKTQILSEQKMRIYPIGECDEHIDKFHEFMVEYLGGAPLGDKHSGDYSCDIFMSRGITENNLGSWTMRICDFMVDRLGWSFVVCNVCNLGQWGQLREQQLIFRWDGGCREIPVTRESSLLDNDARNQYKLYKQPAYWKDPKVKSGEKLQAICPCTKEETEALQEIMDNTFRRILTRDRVYEFQLEVNEEMPFRLEIVQAYRSENVPLSHRFDDYKKTTYTKGGDDHATVVKTRRGGEAINKRLKEGEAFLFHGTNPSSSMNILRGGFVLDCAGKSTGTMFGYGIYLAECASKSDEYSRDDAGGNYPKLRSMVLCRSLVGKPYVAQEAGDYIAEAKKDNSNCVMGDRESKVGTYREFVFFDEAQVTPEYSLIYKRVYDQDKVPNHMRTKTTGSTGRCWQVKLDRGWANVPPNVNHKILVASKNGETAIPVTIGDFDYMFDLAAKKQTNISSGNSRPIRAPRFS